MKICGIIVIVFFVSLYSMQAQSIQCPPDKVCISPEAARKALQDSDTVQAQAKEIAAKDQAFADLQKELNVMRIELAKAIGEKTGSEQMVVRLTAIVDVLLKGQKKKCMPFSVCLF